MKTLLNLLISAILVLSPTAVSLAAIDTGISLQQLWNYKKTAPTDSRDEGELKITFDGKLQNNVTTRVVLKTYLGNYDGGSGDLAAPNIYLDGYYVQYPSQFGIFKAGKWGFKPKGLVDTIDTAYGDFKAEWALQFTRRFRYGFNAGLWFAADKSLVYEVVGDGAYIVTLGWTNGAIEVNVNGVDTGDVNDILAMYRGDGKLNKKGQALIKNDATTQMGYTANVIFNISEGFRPYLHYSQSDIKGDYNDSRWIIGTRINPKPWEIILEYGLNDRYVKDGTLYSKADNAYAAHLKYTFSNKLNIEYTYYYNGYDENKGKNELALNIPIK